MKYILCIILFIGIVQDSISQSIVSGSESKSGILVSGKYLGINYESLSDRLSFNYKITKQDDDRGGKLFQNYWGMNFEAGVKIDKGKFNLIKDKQWQGGIDCDLTLSRTWDNSKEEVGNNHDALIQQHTLFINMGYSGERINTYQTNILNADTTFATIDNPLQNILTFSIGYNYSLQLSSDLFFSCAAAFNLKYNFKSTSKLSSTTLLPTSKSILNSKDSSVLQPIGEQMEYYLGTSESEFIVIPRVDIFFRYKIKEGYPLIGWLFAYSPLTSTNIKPRHCFSFGPTIGLSTFPDQIVFAIMNEIVQKKDSDAYNYALSFQVSFPITFK
jgi:hypothetical protein